MPNERSNDLLMRVGNGNFFAIVVVTEALNPAMIEAMRAALPAGLHIGEKYTLLITKDKEKVLQLDNLLGFFCGLKPITDYLLFEEWQ